MGSIVKNRQYYKFCFYGFLKNLRFFDAFFILFLLGKNLSFTQIGILYAVRQISTNVFEIPSGIIADTYGRKNTLAGSLLAYIFSFVVFYIAGDFWLFMFAFILYGMGEAFRSGTHKGMIIDYLKLNRWEDQKINYYGHTRSWSQNGSALSSLMAGLIVFYSGSYQSIFLYSVIPYLVNFLLILSYPKELDRSPGQKDQTQHRGLELTVKTFFRIIRRADVLRIINTSAVHSAYLQAVKDYIQPLMVNIALLLPFMLYMDAEKKNGIVIGVIYFFIYLLTSRASRMASGIAAKNKPNISNLTLLLGFSLGIITGILFNFEFWVLSLLAFTGIYIVENVRKPILTGFVADHAPTEILVSVISAQSLLKTILTAALALAVGICADRFGIGPSIAVVSLFLAGSTLFINFFSRQKA